MSVNVLDSIRRNTKTVVDQKDMFGSSQGFDGIFIFCHLLVYLVSDVDTTTDPDIRILVLSYSSAKHI
jgi:hypothetical protein